MAGRALLPKDEDFWETPALLVPLVREGQKILGVVGNKMPSFFRGIAELFFIGKPMLRKA